MFIDSIDDVYSNFYIFSRTKDIYIAEQRFRTISPVAFELKLLLIFDYFCYEFRVNDRFLTKENFKIEGL